MFIKKTKISYVVWCFYFNIHTYSINLFYNINPAIATTLLAADYLCLLHNKQINFSIFGILPHILYAGVFWLSSHIPTYGLVIIFIVKFFTTTTMIMLKSKYDLKKRIHWIAFSIIFQLLLCGLSVVLSRYTQFIANKYLSELLKTILAFLPHISSLYPLITKSTNTNTINDIQIPTIQEKQLTVLIDNKTHQQNQHPKPNNCDSSKLHCPRRPGCPLDDHKWF